MKKLLLLVVVLYALRINAQDYHISFVGSGGSTVVTSVKVENLNQGTNLTINGSDVLHLMALVTEAETIVDDETGKIYIYPNPMKDYSRIQFVLPEPNQTIITLYDLSGREIVQTGDLLSKGKQTYRIQGIEEGIYFIRISSGKSSFNGRLVNSGSKNCNAKIAYENTEELTVSKDKPGDSKGTYAETIMQYNTGDRLKFTGTSGIYTTIMTDIPLSDKTVTFNFILCADFDNYNYPVVQIGTQMWMAENLKTTHYSDGTAIDLVTGALNWSALTVSSKAYCWNNDDLINKDTYGALYTWAAAMNGSASSTHTPSGIQGACPTGWNLPSSGDWYMLENYLVANSYNFDGTTVAPNRIGKALATATGWLYSNINNGSIGNNDYPAKKNATGFSALPGGKRFSGGSFLLTGKHAYWWAATEYDATDANNRYTNSDYVHLANDNFSKASGYSVRCVKY
jgi:uncharacterized protein (TIGR02145 family)